MNVSSFDKVDGDGMFHLELVIFVLFSFGNCIAVQLAVQLLICSNTISIAYGLYKLPSLLWLC